MFTYVTFFKLYFALSYMLSILLFSGLIRYFYLLTWLKLSEHICVVRRKTTISSDHYADDAETSRYCPHQCHHMLDDAPISSKDSDPISNMATTTIILINLFKAIIQLFLFER